jgi:predicted nucleic acid-binding protein
MSRIYLDASVIIYIVEVESPFHEAALRSVQRFRGDSESQLITSRLSRLECRVKPVRDSNTKLVEKYDAFFKRRRLIISDVTAAVIERATELRARHQFKTPDAIHLATAIEENVSLFLTGDGKLQRCTEVKVEVLHP